MKVYPAVLAYLKTPRTLEIWAGLTLTERVAKLYHHFKDIQITPGYLGVLYR